jgi:hypothetical protein
MTDFNSINPDKNLSAKFHSNRQAKGGQPDPNAAKGEAAPTGDPYAELKMTPDKMLDLLAAQGRVNSQNQIENPAIEKSVNAFTKSITPERHAQVCKQLEQAYVAEMGSKPHPAVLQDMVDNYLIGKPMVQNA